MFVNRIRIRVEFGDCDPANIVYFATYFRWGDRCTSALFRAAGVPLHQLASAEGVRIPLVDVRMRYMQPSSYGDVLLVSSRVVEWRSSSFVVRHRFRRDGLLVAEGWETHVWAGPHPTLPGRMKGIAVPSGVREQLSAERQKSPLAAQAS